MLNIANKVIIKKIPHRAACNKFVTDNYHFRDNERSDTKTCNMHAETDFQACLLRRQ